MRILIVEDDAALNELLQKLLAEAGFEADGAQSVQMARKRLKANDYDGLIFDVVLPDGNGIDLCKEVRAAEVQTPILMLTGKRATNDKVLGLEAGADDYLAKPFSPRELIARIRAMVRRPASVVSETLQCGPISLDTAQQKVLHDETEVILRPKEFSLLEQLMRRKNQVVRKEELLRHNWGLYSSTSGNKVEVYISCLRQKLDAPFNTKSIKTVHGIGYKIVDEF